MKLYDCTLDKKFKINLCNVIEKKNQVYSFIFCILYPSVLCLFFFSLEDNGAFKSPL